MYSIKAIFTKQPVAIATAVRSILMVLILMSVIVIDEKALAGIALSLELVLGLFAWNASTPVASPTLPVGTKVAVKGTEDKVIVNTSPPGPTGLEGDDLAPEDFGEPI